MRRSFALGVFLSAAVAADVAFPAPPENAGLRVRVIAPFASTATEYLTFASPLPEGGFLAATSISYGEAFAYKISSEGKVVWRITLPDPPPPPRFPRDAQHSKVRFGGVTGAGTYWLAGTIVDATVDSVQLIAKDGSLSSRFSLARPTGNGRFLICVNERSGTYFETNSLSLSKYLKVPAFSVSSTDHSGALIWEQISAFVQGRRIAPVSQEILSCPGLVSTADNHILAAQRVYVWPETHSAEEILQLSASGVQLRPGTLVAAYDSTGREIARLRDDDTKSGLLIPSPTGAILFETQYQRRSPPGSAPRDNAVHVRWLNSSLQSTHETEMILDGDLDLISAAFVTRGGGILLVGCSGTTSRSFVRYVSREHVASGKHELDSGNCGGPYWFSSGAGANEALLIGESAPNPASFIVSLRIPE